MPGPSNFDFLDAVDAKLGDCARSAELLVYRDPAAAIARLRVFGEWTAARVARGVGLLENETEGQCDLINRLRRSGSMPGHVAALLHQLRQRGNRASHDMEGDAETAIELLGVAHAVSVWLVQSTGAAEVTPPFRKPDPAADPTEQLRREADTLRRQIERLRAREGGAPRAAVDHAERDSLHAQLASLRGQLAERERMIERQARSFEAREQELQGKLAHREKPAPSLAAQESATSQPDTGRTAPMSSDAVADSAPTCPACGASMLRRTARRGRNAGGEFWGCSQFPGCRGILPIATARAAGPVTDVAQPRSVTRGISRRPRVTWRDSALRKGWSVDFTNAGGRLRSADLLADQPVAVRAAASQVAVFASEESASISDGALAVSRALRRLVTRGERPPVDPEIEVEILRRAGLAQHLVAARHPGDLAPKLDEAAPLPSSDEIRDALLARRPFVVDDSARLAPRVPLLHPEAERPFLEGWVSAQLGETAGHWFVPQAPLAQLVVEAQGTDARRADFLVAHPSIPPFVVEIDGRQHAQSVAVDSDRDAALGEVGLGVVRIAASEVAGCRGAGLAEIAQRWPRTVNPPSPAAALLAWGPAITHRILLGLSIALERGWLRPDATWAFSVDEPLAIGTVALKAALELADAVAATFGHQIVPARVTARANRVSVVLNRESVGRFRVERSDRPEPPHDGHVVDIRVQIDAGPFHVLPENTNGRTIVIRSASLPVDLVDGYTLGGSRVLLGDAAVPSGEGLQRVLQAVFAKRDFQPDGPAPRGQEVAIRRLLAGKDAAVLLPTGAGKSLIYQLTGALLPGVTLIVDPIVSLIDDQLDGLRQQGIDRAIGITSADTREGTADEKLSRVRAGEAMFVFVAPERLQQRAFREAVRELAASTPISIAVVDEAHCVSEWGHDFRAAYLDLGRVLRDVTEGVDGIAPPILALTGTASRAVLKDMLIELGIDRSDPDAIVSPQTFDRRELRFGIVRADSDELITTLIGTLRSLPSKFREAAVPRSPTMFFEPNGDSSACGIVFCQKVKDRHRGVGVVAAALSDALRRPVPLYAGSAPNGVRDFERVKRENAAAFKSNISPLLVATKAYGMGIDKPNVRYIVHVGVPSSIEAYYQEAGRAGRDRQEAHCLIVTTPEDREVHEYFHRLTFQGVKPDLSQVELVLGLVGDVGKRQMIAIPMGEDVDQRERAIHRLKLLGLVTDYLVDWGGRRFELKVRPVTTRELDAALLAFIRRSQPGRVPAVEAELAREGAMAWQTKLMRNAERMIGFVYETIVEARRRAVDEMALLAESCRDDAQIRDRILRYIALSEIGDTLEELVDRDRFAFEDWTSLIDAMEGADEARDWRGATARLLQSEPNQPGLLLGRGLSEVIAGGDQRVFAASIQRAVESARDEYDVGVSECAGLVSWAIRWLRTRRADWVPLAYLIADRVLGAQANEALVEAEQECLARPLEENVGETAVVMERRIRRAASLMSEIAKANRVELV